jgi:sensor histidine kinase regulating citrate/malate metabolism
MRSVNVYRGLGPPILARQKIRMLCEAAVTMMALLPQEILLNAGVLQDAIFNSANFSSIATDAKGVIQIFNVGAERMLGIGYLACRSMRDSGGRRG